MCGGVGGRVGEWAGVRVGGRMDRRKDGPIVQNNGWFRYTDDE